MNKLSNRETALITILLWLSLVVAVCYSIPLLANLTVALGDSHPFVTVCHVLFYLVAFISAACVVQFTVKQLPN